MTKGRKYFNDLDELADLMLQRRLILSREAIGGEVLWVIRAVNDRRWIAGTVTLRGLIDRIRAEDRVVP